MSSSFVRGEVCKPIAFYALKNAVSSTGSCQPSSFSAQNHEGCGDDGLRKGRRETHATSAAARSGVAQRRGPGLAKVLLEDARLAEEAERDAHTCGERRRARAEDLFTSTVAHLSEPAQFLRRFHLA